MNWIKLESEKQLEEIKRVSTEKPVLIFKHSTRCSISSTALNRFERNWNEQKSGNLQPYYLDLLSFRSVSNKIAEDFGIEHQSPQILLLKNGRCVYDASHFDISFDDLMAIKHNKN